MKSDDYQNRMAAVKRTRLANPPGWMVVGARVDYCGIIGESPTMYGLTVRIEPEQQSNGQWVVWLTGKAGYVAVEACLESSRSQKET
jgi:hypothetical protein